MLEDDNRNCGCMMNNYNGINFPQIKILDYEVITQSMFDF